MSNSVCFSSLVYPSQREISAPSPKISPFFVVDRTVGIVVSDFHRLPQKTRVFNAIKANPAVCTQASLAFESIHQKTP